MLGLANAKIPVEGVTTEHIKVPALSGDVTLDLYVHKPSTPATTPLTCLYTMHGGGHMSLSAKALEYHYQYLASLGVVVAAIEYRLLREHTPYPTQLDDCEAGLQWLASNKSKFGIDKIVLHGESSGATLALTLPLRLRRKQLDLISGTIAITPLIGPLLDTPSRREFQPAANNFANLEKAAVAFMKAPENDIEAWPINAKAADLEGFPKTLLVMSELDTLRDEGITYARLLAESGSPVVSLTLNGSLHHSPYIALIDEENYRQLCDMAASFARRC